MHNQYPLWKYILLLIMIAVGVVYSIPNIYGEDYAVQVSLKDSDMIPTDADEKIKSVLKQQNIDVISVTEEDGQVLVRVKNADLQMKVRDLVKATLSNDYVVALNLAPRTPAWLQKIGASPLKLGLDLRGGVHFLLQVDVDDVIQARETGEIHTISSELRQAQIRYASIKRAKDGGIIIKFREADDKQKAITLLPQRMPDYALSELDNGKTIKAVLTDQSIRRLRDFAVDQTMTIIRNRINELGVSEAVVQRQGLNKIAVDLPGVQDTARAKDIIGKTASLKFHMVDTEHDVQSALAGVVPMGTRLYRYEDRPYLLNNQIILEGSAITFATATTGENGRPEVQVRLGGGGEGVFYRTTAENIGKPMAVVMVETVTEDKLINGKIVTTQKPVEKIISVATIINALGNNFSITNLDSMQYAQNLALLLRSGAFTAPVQFIQERIVGPSLGKSNIDKGILSIEVGSLLVILFMLMYYRIFGLFANFALLLNIVFIVAILSMLDATLTLTGIAGIVLTVGMAVDANVLINERIREELRNGMTSQAAIRAGYEKAFTTIVDSNVTTLIVAIVLFTLSSGSVKGFAVTLTIGLLTSMVTAIFFTRALVNLVYGRRQVKRLSIGTVVGKTA